MGNGVNLGNRNNVSIADMCGHKVLGMSGSLTNYIMTGDTSSVDSFRRTNKKTVRKILISLFISILFISAFSVIAFAQETQPVDIDKEEVKYVSSEQVYQVFGGYFTMFESIPDGKTIAKSDLLESLNTSKVPTRIILDLEINSEELISEDDLIMSLEEIEKEHEKKDFYYFIL